MEAASPASCVCSAPSDGSLDDSELAEATQAEAAQIPVPAGFDSPNLEEPGDSEEESSEEGLVPDTNEAIRHQNEETITELVRDRAAWLQLLATTQPIPSGAHPMNEVTVRNLSLVMAEAGRVLDITSKMEMPEEARSCVSTTASVLIAFAAELNINALLPQQRAETIERHLQRALLELRTLPSGKP